jgi:hypothetical protein
MLGIRRTIFPLGAMGLLLLAQVSWATTLTLAQCAVLSTDILTTHQGEFASMVADGNNPAVAAAYNLHAVPDYWVWKTSLSKREIVETTTEDGTTFSYTIHIGRSQGERDTWTSIVPDPMNPSLLNLRQAFADIYSGVGGAPQRTHLLAIARKRATRVQQLLLTPSGASPGSTGNPQTLVYLGAIDNADVALAVRTPTCTP